MKQKFAKKILLLVLAVCLSLAAFALTACKKDDGKTDGDDGTAPETVTYTVTCVDCTASVTKAEKGQTVTLTPATKDGKTFTGYTTNVESVTVTDNKFTMPESDITVTAQYETNKYTIVWKDESGTVLETDENVEYGATPTYDGSTPTKDETVAATFAFDGWTPAVATVTGNAEYTAHFTETAKTYTVVWKNYDGTTLKTEQVAYGSVPSYTGETPTQASSAQYEYTFSGWDTEPVAVDENGAEYTAQFSQALRKYTITFVNSDGTSVLQTKEVEYGTVPTYDRRNLGGEITWDETLSAVDGEKTYRATATVALYDKKMTEGETDGEYVVTDNVPVSDEAYYYFEGKSDTVVFSTDISVPNMTSPLVGITITNGAVLNGKYDNNNNMESEIGAFMSTQIMINGTGIYTCLNHNGFIKRGASGNDADYSADKGAIEFRGTTHKLGVVLYSDTLYFYIDGEYITSRAITHDNISRESGATHKYASGDEFMFGLVARETGDATVTFGNIVKYYGDDATAYINAHCPDVTTFRREGMSRANGVYTSVGGGYRQSAYFYTSPDTYDRTAVYSVKFSITTLSGEERVELGNLGGQTPVIGITVTDGKTVMGKQVDNRPFNVGKLYSVQLGLSTTTSFRSVTALVAAKGRNFGTVTALGAGHMTDRTVTAVLYNDKLYLYADGQFVVSKAMTDPDFTQASNPSGDNYAFAANGEYTFGVVATNLDNGVNRAVMQVVTEKYGDEALAEIQANYTDITVAA